MPQSLVKNLIHIVFSTKDRQPWIVAEHRPGLCAYMAGIFRDLQSPALIIGGVDDHIHALFSMSKNHALKSVVEEIKKGTSKWMKREGARNPEFFWQGGYAAFSVSVSNADQVKKYIEDQEEHHRKVSFQDVQRHGVDYDEQYVWD